MFAKDAGAGAGAGTTKQQEGVSLNSVLEIPAQRVELALLVLLCIDCMRSDLEATFEHLEKADSKAATSPYPAPKPPTQDLISFDDPQVETPVAHHVGRESKRVEIDSAQMHALQRSALTFFDKWRGAVMLRICSVLSVRGETVRQAKARRKQTTEDIEKQKHGISSLIDFDQDPFAAPARTEKQHGHYKVISTGVLTLDEPKRVLVLHCLLLLLLSLEHYPAHSRVLLLRLASSLELETDVLAAHEKSVALGLLTTAASQMDADATATKQASNNAATRRWKVGLAAVGGAVLIGVTGGLAAPLLAAGMGTVMGGLGLGVVSTYLGALASSSLLVGSLFGAYGAKMTGRLMEQYAKEVEDFEFIPVQDPGRSSFQRDHEWADEQDARDPAKREQHRLRVAIGISGWLSSSSDVHQPWEVIDTETTEPFALRFELDAMLRLGNSLQDVLFNYAWDSLAYKVVSSTMLGALYAGLWPLGLIKVVSVLDNPFSVALARADKAGKVLAHALIDGVQGKRPVTLMGYSVGARVIFACLIELAEQHAFGLVESVVLMGAPAPSYNAEWRKIRSVVAARVVNVYSTDDYVLGYLYRSTKFEMGVAGLGEVNNVHGIENFDMSKLINGHDRYRYLAGKILVNIGFGDVNFDKVSEQERALEQAERAKQRYKEEARRNKFKKESSTPESDSSKVKDLTEFLDEPTRQQSLPPPSRPHPRPTFDSQSKSSQQPARQRLPARQQSAPESQRIPATDLDPLGVAPLIDTSSPVHKQPSFCIASASRQSQIPSSMVAELSAHNKPLRTPESASTIVPSKALGTVLETRSAVTGTEQILVQGGGHSSIDDDYVVDVDDTSSDFGELTMVEPEPMDEFDYGLM